MPRTDAPPIDAAALRAAEFPRLGAAPYLNAASAGPLPERAVRAVEEHLGRRVRIHELRADDFEPTLDRARAAAARLVGGEPDEIALGGNTSFGINLAAQVLPLRERGRRILVSDREFPANVYPWMGEARRTGLELEIVPADARGLPDEERLLEELARGDVAALAVSAVQFASGWLADLPRLGRACRDAGAFLVVDAIQAVGQVPIDVRAMEVDLLATGGHKWLCGPFGTGFTWMRRELAEALEPRAVGWTRMEASADFAHLLDYRWEPVSGARRFEVATLPFHDFAGLAASMELLAEVGVERVREHVLALLDPVVGWLRERGGVEAASDLSPERRSGILAFRPPDPAAAFAALHAAGVGCVLREGAVRLSPHLYNTADEVARVLEILDGEAGR